ncbi:hypothetical protein [Rhizobium paknamense]|uniref:Uncharacterized protein n=1 Tax=Rhizobium paknamense TaxID=1206817 RepID=A0ABU0IM21_9HYPH|nr:hypothetical protein [Rhizobium paknamense]MDQ0458244.1 hypothetical protein [Rhizobium paknamense]
MAVDTLTLGLWPALPDPVCVIGRSVGRFIGMTVIAFSIGDSAVSTGSDGVGFSG